MNLSYLFFSVIPLLGYLSFLFYLSSVPITPVENPIPFIDKLFHFLLYIPVPILFFRFLRTWISDFIFIGIVLAVLYAVSDEVHQYFVPTRMMSFWDGVFDCLGIIAGVLLYRVFKEV